MFRRRRSKNAKREIYFLQNSYAGHKHAVLINSELIQIQIGQLHLLQ